MSYHFNKIEEKWQKYWAENQTFKASNNSEKPKYYVLDMFPYPSGAGLHVGHPLGYIASDIYARFKRHKGFNVLHPQGYDSFGLPAEQYAIQTGQHPAVTTENNIARYREQLDKIGFSFDWSREVRTSEPNYYKWTQWIFIQLFESWYDHEAEKSRSISELKDIFSSEGNSRINAACDDDIEEFSAEEWIKYSQDEKEQILLKYRLTYLAETEVNWCPQLGTVLANDEIVNGVSERGGYPVVRKKMTQWSMRISAFAERLLQDLNKIDWTESLKESQRNWIGKSVGAHVDFKIKDTKHKVGVFTTRPDTIFGVTFMTLAPEHDLVKEITSEDRKQEVQAYIEATAKRSERERMADVKSISGVFTGAYAQHPFTGESIPIWIGDYVLAGYGTGAVMAVPCGDQRDHDFARHFDLPITNIFENVDVSQEAYAGKEGTVIANSDFLSRLEYKEALNKVILELEKTGQGYGKTNYRLRDAVFSRQRYWGEPFPVYYVNGLPKMIDLEHLPLRLPEVEKYLPTETGEPPLGNATNWAWDTKKNKVVSNKMLKQVQQDESNFDVTLSAVEGAEDNGIYPLELNTMPGWAGSSWYLFRYMDAGNPDRFVSEEAQKYWENVDLYIGGSEHATGHLLYSRFWTKFLHDRGWLTVEEPFKKLINQGMILGTVAYYPYHDITVSLSFDVKDVENFNSDKILITDYRIVVNVFSEIEENVYHEHDTFRMKVNIVDEMDIRDQVIDIFLTRMSEIKIPKDKIRVSIDSWSDNNEPKRIPFKSINPNSLEIDMNELRKDERFRFAVKTTDQSIHSTTDIGKMSKSWLNVVSPDEICEDYGADTLRMYEMFLGPLEQAKPWNTAGITGVHNFLKKLWKLYHSSPGPSQGGEQTFFVSEEKASADSLKTFHKTIKKVTEDIEDFSFNTSVSTFMICVNELTAQKCNSREILEPLSVLIAPYAPHIAEELWEKLGHSESITTAKYPEFEEKYLVESVKNYPISFNGKMRFTMELPLDMAKDEVEKNVMADDRTQKHLEGRTPKKVIVVPGKIVNIVG